MTQWAKGPDGEFFLLDSVRKTRKERLAEHAARERERRAQTAHLPDSRVVDRCIVEALVVVLGRLDPEVGLEVTRDVMQLAVDGLVERGHDRGDAKSAFDDRLRRIMASEGPTRLVQRARRARKAGREPGAHRHVREHAVTS